MGKTFFLFVFLVTTCILTLLLLLEKTKQTPTQTLSNATIAMRNEREYPFLSKRIFLENQNDMLINFTPLRQALREYVKKQKEPLGVYFEYLPSGVSIGVNDTVEVNLASLLKVPVVMAVYKQIESGKIKKSNVIEIKEEHLDQRFGEGWKMGEGTKLTVEHAITLALTESDNTASNVLLSSLPDGAIDDVFDSLDIPKDTKGSFHFISPKSYSSILRSLYLSSYLSNVFSNEIITLLTKTKFTNQIPAGVPSTIPVAHKIGVFDLKDAPKTYSDCGIVYVPNRPYVLCIMTSASEEEATAYMQHISKMVYGYIYAVNK